MAKDEIVDAEGTGAPSADAFFTGVVIFTTVALFSGFILIEMAWSRNYARGLFS